MQAYVDRKSGDFSGRGSISVIRSVVVIILEGYYYYYYYPRYLLYAGYLHLYS